MIFPDNNYDSKEIDYILRDKISNIKAQIDLLYFGGMDNSDENEQIQFLKHLKQEADVLYQYLNTSIVEKANAINHLLVLLKLDLSLAKKIQQKIISQDIIQIGKLRFHHYYAPLHEVGGDFYDISEIEPGKVRVFLADATGHGVQAALITMLIKSEYEKLKAWDLSPSVILQKLNLKFTHTYRNLSVLFSALIADIDLHHHSINYSSASHPPQFLLSSGKSIRLDSSRGMIGILENIHLRDQSLDFREGDKLLLYTDGLYEEFDETGESYGFSRLENNISHNTHKEMEELIPHLIASLDQFRASTELNDDIAVIGIQYEK